MKVSLLVAALLASATVHAADVRVTDAWARATVPGQKVSGAYMNIQSDTDARLVSATSAAVPRVEVHEMKMEGDVMRMREVKFIDLPGGKAVSLEPGGYHIMLMNLKQPIKAGEIVPIVLTIESGGKRQTVEVKAAARAPGTGAMPHKHMH